MNLSEKIINARKQKPIQIFSKGNGELGVSIIESPVKLAILSMLENNEMKFNEIVENLEKSAPTVSAHLKSLRKDGIVSFKFDPEDERKKIFYINSRLLGEIKFPEPFELEEQKTDFLLENIMNRSVEESNTCNFSYLFFHTHRSILIQEGININPIFYETGRSIGLALYEKAKTDDIEVFAQNFKEFWQRNGLGKVEIRLGEKIVIKNYQCFECKLLPKTGKPVCYLESGIIESSVSSFLKEDLKVNEIKCFSMGDNCCEFQVETI